MTGANVWDEEWELGGLQGGTGNPFQTTDRIRSVNYCPCKPSTSYYGYFGTTNSVLIVWWFDAEKHYINAIDGTNKVITTPANAAFFKISTYSGNYTTYLNDISINYPSTDTSYHAYTGEPVSVTFPSTIYGGTDEVISGNGTSTMGMVDLGTLDWNVSDGRFNTLTPISNAKGGNHADCLCSIYKSDVGAATRAVDCSICFANNGYVYIYDTTFSGDASAFKAAMNGVQLCYELATPQTFAHTGQEVDTLVGQNNVWVDTGDVSVTYQASIKGYIDKVLGQ